MSAPIFVAEYESAWNTTGNKNVLVTVDAGDVLVVYALAENGLADISTPTMTGVTFALITSAASQSSDNAEALVWGGVASQSGTFTLAVNNADASTWWGFSCLRFTGSDGVGASAAALSSPPVVDLTTTGANSAIVAALSDWNAADGSSRTWQTINGITPTAGNGLERTYFRDSSRYTVYAAYWNDVGAAGLKSDVGLTAPGGTRYAVVVVEVLGSAPGPVTVALTPAVATLTAVPVVATPGPVTVALTPAVATLTAVPVVATPGPVTVALTPTLTTLTAVAVEPAPGSGGVALIPAALTLTAAPVTATPGPVTVALTPAALTLAAPALTATPGPVSVALTPAVATLTAVPLDLPATTGVTIWDGNQEIPATVTIWDGAAEIPATVEVHAG